VIHAEASEEKCSRSQWHKTKQSSTFLFFFNVAFASILSPKSSSVNWLVLGGVTRESTLGAYFVSLVINSANRPYDDQIYDCNLEISPAQAIIKRNCQNWSKHSKVTSLPKTVQPLL
jgi:hypothetical protein